MIKKLFFVHLLIVSYITVKSQALPNAFVVTGYAEVLPNDSLKIYYGSSGTIFNKKCAEFYRIGKIDPDRIGFTGGVHDYNLAGKMLFKANIVSGELSGKAYYYYPDGKVKETGEYSDNIRIGIWKYYYDNGNAEKILNFDSANPDILQEYSRSGKILVSNGNGTYTGTFDSFFIRGRVTDGKMDGDWEFDRLSTEKFDRGKFINGISTERYGSQPYNVNLSRIHISGFYPNENAKLSENQGGCPGQSVSFTEFQSKTLGESFYPQLIDKIKKYPALKNQWLIAGIEFKKNDEIKVLNVYSSKDDTGLERYVYDFIMSRKGWRDGVVKPTYENVPLFFTINIDNKMGNEKVLIPAEYLLRTNPYFKPADTTTQKR